WDRYNEQSFNVLYLSITGSAASYLSRFQPKGSEKPNVKSAWEGLVAKYQNSSKQRRRLLMRQLDTMTISPGQDPDVFLVKLFQLRDELGHIGESISDERLTDIVVEGLTSEGDQVKYNAERDPDLSIGDIETTLCYMYANRLARKVTASRSHGRDSSMLAAAMSHSLNQAAKFRGKCFLCGRRGHHARDGRSSGQSNHQN
ncbi:unnamed protein product, partial [Sphacelaria rigidula]